MQKTVELNNCAFDILTDGDRFLGLGAIKIGGTQVRSGRLPLRPATQTFTGLELAELRLLGVDTATDSVRIKLKAIFHPLPVKLMRDHSFDPIHELGDWDTDPDAGEGDLDLVLLPASDTFGSADFQGFSYHYEYRSDNVPLFNLLDKASWELDGNIEGCTVITQSSCSAPMVTFKDDTRWSTEGLIHWQDDAARSNPVMTHNLPRWASHGSFDFQYKGDRTLIGVFEHVDLIRTVLQREPSKPELKTFDKYIFDQTLNWKSPAKSIMLNTDHKTRTDQENLWTWITDAVHDRARAEFGLQEVPLIPRLYWNYWDNFVIDDYLKDLLPAAAALGFKAVFIDNVNKSAMTELCPNAPFFHWNMCSPHEYEVAPRLGGPESLKRFITEAHKRGVRPNAWTNDAQALSSPINDTERDDKNWFLRMEDTRMKYGGAYTNIFSVLDFKKEAPRRYWVDSMKRIKEETGLDSYLFDSFYNLGFMPVNYSELNPTTQWRELLGAFKELQESGIDFLIESFGPFGSPQHGCPVSFGFPENVFTCYKMALGLGYTTIPSGTDMEVKDDAETIYRFLANMASPGFSLFQDRKRIDELWTDKHKQALADYNNNRTAMHRRFLQEDSKGILWHDATGNQATLWNFVERDAKLPGKVTDLTAGQDLPAAESYHLARCHTYAIKGAELPVAVG